ncbi:TPA: DNA repair protein RecN [Candidatus Gastranaerophilales bacterium HUM_20]|nr:dNA repair protein (Recombination protein N) [Clostridium sp. CAG:729]DAB18576.1 MAG TPA: DNA repair protein RecN [Candidatus Gastranaerophilales bacterium HUM_20]
MIKQLRIKDYILIDELTANFDNGLNVITGETGAGKSILINAIDIAFAPRVSKEVIKHDKEKAVVELVIENTKHDLTSLFDENGIDYLGSEIVLTKEITPNGVRARVNGTLVNQEFIKQLKNYFLDIHSQHQTYAFMQPKYHINLLDNYAKESYGKRLEEYKEKFKEYRLLQSQLENLKTASDMTENQLEFLKFQIDEIDSANIQNPTEDEDLNNELEVLENAEKLKELTGSAYWAINGDDGSIMEALSKIKQNVSKASSMDKNLEETETDLIDAIERLKDAASALRDYSQNLDNDTERLNEIQERLFLLDKLKRKYGGTLEAVMETFENLSKELNAIEFSTQNIDELEAKITQMQKELEHSAGEISECRKNYSKVLSVLIEEKLEKLELPKARFNISVEPKELSSDGADEVEFLISTNVSEDLKPLAKVASGGEISRVMLAIKSIFAQSDDINTVIFDEIDTGISGKASQSVADEIAELSKYHQIILITHQPIIASRADKHFYVRKSQSDETKVEVYVLTGENRVKALAELAGGEINEQSIEFAKSLINI